MTGPSSVASVLCALSAPVRRRRRPDPGGESGERLHPDRPGGRGAEALYETDGSNNEERAPDVRYEWRPLPSPAEAEA